MSDDKSSMGIQSPAGVPSSPIRFPRSGGAQRSPPSQYVNHSCGRPMAAVRFIRDGEPPGTEERGWRCPFCDYQRPATDEESQQWESARGYTGGGRSLDVRIPTEASDPRQPDPKPAPEQPASVGAEADPEKPATMPIPETEDEFRKLLGDHPHLKESAERLLSKLQGVTEGEPAHGTWVCPTCEESNPLTEPISGELAVTCTCGKSAEIAVYAVGEPMKLTCPPCGGTPFEVARERLPEEEGDILELSCPNCEALHELRREHDQIRWVPPAVAAD